MTQDKKPLHFTLEERKIVEKHYRTKTRTAIAEMLGRSTTSILYELKRSSDGPYNAIRAQKDADKKKRQPKKKPEGFSPRKYVREEEVIENEAVTIENEATIWGKIKSRLGL